jgi:putative endonuclease
MSAITKDARPYTVYMLRCKGGSLYTGITTDVARRFRQHVAGVGGAYTRSHMPTEVVYTEVVCEKGAALQREACIKKMSHATKKELCATLKI